ncbi:MAG TPA: lysylphosphatidylglycerol synthase transmembrane domain-containing protein [Planctomycetaceae bacterium]|nr:lysylphosphatidylglycerol synthase transmembrane domain-containing protein [Planctomycetaceae bacterium]
MNALRVFARWFKRHWGWLKWLVAAGVLALLFVRYRDTFTGRAWGDIRWAYLAGALALCAGAMLLTFFRWYVLVWAQEFPFALHDALRLGFIGYLFNFVAPGVVGGDLVKATLIAREQKSRRMIAAATVLIDRIVGLLALLLIGSVAVLAPTPLASHAAFRTGMAVFWIGSAVGLCALAVTMHPALPRSGWLNRMIHWPLVGRPIGELINALLLYQARRRVVLFTLGVSLVSHMGLLTGFYLGALAMHAPESIPGFVEHLQMIPAAELVGVVVPLPGGSGALEGAVAELYRLAQADPGDGLLTALAYRAVTIVIALVGAAYYFASRREIGEALDEAHAVPPEPSGQDVRQ